MNIKEEESSIFLWIDERVVYPLPVCRRTPQDSDIFLVWEKDQQKQNKFASKHSSGPRRISGLPLKRQRKINRQAPLPRWKGCLGSVPLPMNVQTKICTHIENTQELIIEIRKNAHIGNSQEMLIENTQELLTENTQERTRIHQNWSLKIHMNTHIENT